MNRIVTKLADWQVRRPVPIPPALTGGDFVEVKVDVGTFWVPAQDQVMRPYYQHRRSWEETTSAVLRRFIRPGTRFLDVGAALGYFSVLAAAAAKNVAVDSVEPNPATLDLLRFNLWSNGVSAAVWPVALDTTPGALPLTSSENNIGDTRGDRPRDGQAYSVVVPAVPADDLFTGRTFDVVKIDVQGWELDVALGMQRIIAESPDIAIVTEFWPAALRERDNDPIDILEAYRKLGLHVVVFHGNALVELSDDETVMLCDSAGPDGQVNLLLRRR